MSSFKKKDNHVSSSFQQAGPYLGLGTQLAATVILMFFLGKWLDDKYETTPLFILLLSFLGGIAGFYNFIKRVMELNKDDKKDN
ncbi:MAG: AtpZ/AtpI family protein [Melioribacteraceae bacterium]|nr:AtpZ/AtpI family protein [Melioribacteraceae bacterium]MCF8264638.1 AtpZ/AtpI family protein [Melioribacteraceae bacterium]MCF8411988.1 AtpZ/AtpI family protein [Melioribacteraceae bacterium]